MPDPNKTDSSPGDHLLSQLKLIDPELARKTEQTLLEKKESVTAQEAAMLEEEAVNALSHDIDFGETVIEGLARLIVRGEPERIEKYLEVTKAAAEKGLNLARMISRYWLPVLVYGDRDMLERFPFIVKILLKKGEYTLKKPFDYLSRLLETGRHQTALSFLGLLADTFSQELPYALSLKLARLIPQSVSKFPEAKKNWQISQLRRVVREDVVLTNPFLKSMEMSLHMLSEDGLRRFVTMGLEKYEKNESLGLKFLSLASKLGVDAYQELLVTVSLPQMREGMNRYLQARTGLKLSVRPLSMLPAHAFSNEAAPPLVCSDGQFIYLADDISHFEDQDANRRLYKCLTRLESAYYEFGTFSFDLDRAKELCRFSAPFSPSPKREERGKLQHYSDAERFFHCFSDAEKAEGIFSAFEQGRIRLCLEKHYPGIIRAAFPFLDEEIMKKKTADYMTALFAVIGLGMSFDELPNLPEHLCSFVKKGLNLFLGSISTESPVEASALLVHQFYPDLETLLSDDKIENLPFDPPFGRKIRFDLHHTAFSEMDKISRKIKNALAEKGLKTYRADIQEELIQKGGVFSKEDLANLVVSGRPDEEKSPSAKAGGKIDLSWFDLKELFKQSGVNITEEDASPHPAFWYKEWDADLGDYLQRHTRVLDRFVTEIPSGFYDLTLQRRYGLVRGVRRAFELLKPEGLVLLRNWVEGDEFDYRALLDFAIDRKAGLMPSDRLYIKRIKQHRDVAVMLLVDLSHSISNTVYGSSATVLDVEKEAIILFCEALEVVGDRFAVAGFSGTGRLSVDYLRIKEFEEPVDDAVKARINGMSPLRSTRMGAAIRHAAAQLKETPAKVRLMIILGDGFPNDVDYKREYAIADTRKAIAEARAENIHAKAITVNIVGDKRLDDLYGSFHHNVITDVRELPTKLLRIYSALTR